MSNQRFFTKKIYLDTIFSRKTQDSSVHWIGSTFKSFAVIDSNDSNFELSLVPDPENGSVEGIPLQEGGWHNFTVEPKNGCFENNTVQAGKWVKVLISVEDPLTSGKIQAIVTSLSVISEGSSYSQNKITVSAISSEIIPANDSRRIARLQYKSGGSEVWIGSDLELSDPDYQNICLKIAVGDDFEFRNTSAIYAKTATGSTVFSLSQGLS